MIHKIVRYKVKTDKLPEVKAAIQTFVSAIRAEEPTTFYAAYSTPDPTVYFHTMLFVDQAAEAYHRTAPHTQAFVEVLYPNCDEAPVFTDLTTLATTQHD